MLVPSADSGRVKRLLEIHARFNDIGRDLAAIVDRHQNVGSYSWDD